MARSGILVVGAGELGFAMLEALASHPQRHSTRISVMLRQESIKHKPETVSAARALGADAIEPGDFLRQPVEELAEIFARYHTVVQCAGFAMPPGTQLRVAQAALAAGVAKFVPWQFGCDYDAIGRGSVMELFDEMVDVRDMLREQKRTDWLVVSTGLFTSFLFLASFGVVDAKAGVLRALGGWDNRISLTTPQDVGRMTAEALFVPPTGNIVHVAGDTLSYKQIADLVEALCPSKAWRRELWDLDTLHERLRSDGGDLSTKYQIMFGGGKGVGWDMATTLNTQRGLAMTDVKQYIAEHPDVLA
ncbi:hypothetical protein MAPG_05319 [Magnaporthiopsis poae ATCC 64411]|uniref:NmrA-like domain-containing protein n=1 Tax=Magnaporthiopsis poae (strain ATCC 64411 / 73-15) TaxID=644358 RepID=A0A0C4DZ31_MAGP6|nr:hypothetical protein MAPG_05319 [Magnaporthiopsis poae ATCC 64411]